MWYNKIVQDLGNIPAFIDYYYAELNSAKNEVRVSGVVEKNLAQLPGITEHRFNQLQEIEAILEYLNIELRRIKSKAFKKYLENYGNPLATVYLKKVLLVLEKSEEKISLKFFTYIKVRACGNIWFKKSTSLTYVTYNIKTNCLYYGSSYDYHKKRKGNGRTFHKNGFAKKPFESLYQIYVRFHDEAEKNPDYDKQGAAFFKRLEAGDEPDGLPVRPEESVVLARPEVLPRQRAVQGLHLRAGAQRGANCDDRHHRLP